jgi:hypothetical protein
VGIGDANWPLMRDSDDPTMFIGAYELGQLYELVLSERCDVDFDNIAAPNSTQMLEPKT